MVVIYIHKEHINKFKGDKNMRATEMINLLEKFEIKSCGHSTLAGAMVATFGIDYDNNPMYVEVEKYVAKCMTYDSIAGEWY